MTIKKANGELVRRHPSDIILLLHSEEIASEVTEEQSSHDVCRSRRPQRVAKFNCLSANRNLAVNDLV